MTEEEKAELLLARLELARIRLDVAALQTSVACGDVLKFFILVVVLITSCALGRMAHLILAKL